MENIKGFLYLAIIAAVVFGIDSILKARRRRAMAQFAGENGYNFYENPALLSLPFLRPAASPLSFSIAVDAGLPFFDRGRSRTTVNIITIPVTNGQLFVLDHSYYRRHSKNSSRKKFTPAVFVPNGGSLPEFMLRPEGLFDKLGAMAGMRDINFEEYQVFSKKYWLQSPHTQDELRRVFTPELVGILEREPGWEVESGGDYLLFLKKQGSLSISELRPFIDSVTAMCLTLRPAAFEIPRINEPD